MQPSSPAVRRDAILDVLYSGLVPQERLFMVLDGARDDRVYSTVDMTSMEKSCLYAGQLAPEMKITAPYLLQLDRDDRWTRYIIEKGWGQSWGIFLRTDVSMDRLRRHLRRFLVVLDDTGKRMLFRYYDPRVLRGYLPTCLTGELRFVFGPVREFVTENEDGTKLLTFGFDGVNLMERSTAV